MKRKWSWMSICFLFINQLLFGQNPVDRKMAICPFHSIGVDDISVRSAESILIMEMGRSGEVDLVPMEQVLQVPGAVDCADTGCAAEIGRILNAGQVILCTLSRLGEKIIVQYSIVDVQAGKAVFEDLISATAVEDLDTVMKRVAASVVRNESIKETAEVGLITEMETQEPKRRSARRINGFSFGYLFPKKGYADSDRVFAMDFRTGAEFEDYAYGMQLFIRKGFGVNVFASYLISRGDFCPYLNGALGFHWVSHNEYQDRYYYNESGYYQTVEQEPKKGDGFEIGADFGLRLFHTYNIQILVNLGYSFSFNDFKDQGILLTFGLLK